MMKVEKRLPFVIVPINVTTPHAEVLRVRMGKLEFSVQGTIKEWLYVRDRSNIYHNRHLN